MPMTEFRTSDMALAAALAAHGLSYTVARQKEDRHRVMWIFSCSNGRMAELVDEYHQDELYVEARRFMRSYANVRGDMYRLLGVRQRRLVAS